MIFYYAQITDGNIVSVISQQPTKIDAPNMIKLDSIDEAKCGDLYNPETGEFTQEG